MREGGLAFRALQLIPRHWLEKRFLAFASAGFVLLLCLVLGFAPLVRYRARKTAQLRGLTVDIGTVWPRMGGVSLRDVRFRAVSSDWLHGELARVDVGVGFGLSLRSIRVEGGKITITGSVDDVTEEARALNKSSSGAPREGGDKNGLEFEIGGLGISWEKPLGNASQLEVSGIRAERKNEPNVARGLVSVESVRLDRGDLHGNAQAFLARFVRDHEGSHISEVKLRGLLLELPLGRAASSAPTAPPAAPTPPLLVAPPPPAASAPKGRGRKASTPSLPLPAPPVPAAPPARLGNRTGYAEQAAALRGRLTRLATWSVEHIAADAPIGIEGLTIVLTQANQRLNIGPGKLDVRHDPRYIQVNFSPGQSHSGAGGDASGLSFQVRVPVAEGEIAAQVEGGPVTLASLGVHEQDFGLFDVAHAKLAAKGELKLSADAAQLSFDGEGRGSSLSVVHKALADDPVQGLEVAWRARGAAALDGSMLRLDEVKMELGAIHLEASLAIDQGRDFTHIEGKANIPTSDCQHVFESLPRALVPKLAGMKMTGAFGLHSGFELDTRRPADMQIDWDLKNRCRITKAPPEIDVERFTTPFKHTVYDEHGEKVEIIVGPGTPEWSPYHVMSQYLEAAVTTTEDGGFRLHKGFDKSAIRNSIRDNLRNGRFVRGASTITMQLAKNLYLERAKNLSRKLQEAVLTTYLEQELTKEEILELYFNVVEFGPMLYGVGPAATYYFDTSPHELSLAQSLFLTSLLPNPKRTYFGTNGQLSKSWSGYLHRVMKIMRDRGKINDAELLDGVSELLTFGVAKSPRVTPSEDLRRELGPDFAGIVPDGP